MSMEEAAKSEPIEAPALDGQPLVADHRLDDLATAAADREAEWLAGPRKRRRVPNPRIIGAGAFILRVAGIFILILGFWPFFLAIFHVIGWFQGKPIAAKISGSATDWHVDVLEGWPA